MARFLTNSEFVLFARLGDCPPSDFPNAGDFGDVTHSGSGTGIIWGDGFPIDAYQVQILVTEDGEVGATQFRCSLNNGTTYRRAQVANNRIEILNTGIVLCFQNGVSTPSFVKGDTYSFSTTASPELEAQIEASSDELEGYFGASYNLPLLKWGNDVKRHCAMLTRFHLMVNRGIRGDDLKTYQATYDQSIAWAKEVALGNLRINVQETPSSREFFPDFIKNNPKPAWRR